MGVDGISYSLHCNENPICVIPEKELCGLSPISTFMCLCAIYIFPGSVHIFLQQNMQTDLGNI
jgi:hypothetical protein